jgi:hypothetical protein
MVNASERQGPRISRRRVAQLTAVLAAVVGLLALAAGVGAGSSASQRQDSPRRHEIHIVTTQVSVALNSAGLGGPGDVRAQLFTFPLPDGQSGHIATSTTQDTTAEQLSHVAFVFPDGQVDAQAAIALPPTHFVAAVIGGTGAYEGVAGHVVNDVISTSPLTIDRTLYLIYPRPAQG